MVQPVVRGPHTRIPPQSRKPVSIEVIEEGEERHVLLTYANGHVVKQRVEIDQKARRRPRRPQTRLKLRDRKKAEE